VQVREHSARTGATPPEIEVRNPVGSVSVEAIEGAEEVTVRVEALDGLAEQLLDRVDVHLDGGPDGVRRVRVTAPERRLLRSPHLAVRITTPPDAPVRVAVASADADLRGRLGRAELTGASGDWRVDEVADLQLRTASGDARIGAVAGRATVGSASAHVRIESVTRGLEVRTASGDVEVGTAAGDLSIATASGDVGIRRIFAGSAQVRTVSGDVTVGVAPGLRVWLDLSSVSGRMESELDGDDGAGDDPAQLSIAVRSVSGDQRIRRAAEAPTAAG
jgi:Putative adhesin